MSEISDISDRAVDALAEFLIQEDWPKSTGRGRHALRYHYRCQAAAILAGEAWAIRKAWPEAAAEIKTRSDWSPSSLTS